MGSTVSIESSQLARSLIGKKYRAVIPICFGYTGCDKCYFISKWSDPPSSPSLVNPGPGSFHMQIFSSVEFIVTDMLKQCDIFDGGDVVIKAKLLNNIKLENISNVYEEHSYLGENRSTDHWVKSSLDTLRTTKCPSIVKDNRNVNYLKTSNLEITIDYHGLGLYIPKINDKVDLTGTIINNALILKEVK